MWTLESLYAEAGLQTTAVFDERALQSPWTKHTRRWLDRASAPTALAIHDAACLLDLEGIIIDGSMSRELLQSFLTAVARALETYDWQGVTRPVVHAGSIGADARAVGGALLPLYANFAPDRDLFIKEHA